MEWYLQRLDDATYAQPLDLFSGSSIGQHTRHMLEFFQCLLAQQAQGTINYEARARNRAWEQSPGLARQVVQDLGAWVLRTDLRLNLVLETRYDPAQPSIEVPTTLARELIYNIEHTIHHLAMIKIALRTLHPDWELPEGFGVAPSTLYHRAHQGGD